MSNSKEYKELYKQLDFLRTNFLPKKFSETGDYQNEEKRLSLAYRVLAHAEFEFYLEERVKKIAHDAIVRWQNYKQSSNVLLYLLAFSGLNLKKPPDMQVVDKGTKKESWIMIEEALQDAFDVFYKSIRENHGIKEVNMMKLLMPIGFNVKELDPIWLADLNSFGVNRGEAAHQSGVKHDPNPEDELKTVNKILLGFEALDIELDTLQKKFFKDRFVYMSKVK